MNKLFVEALFGNKYWVSDVHKLKDRRLTEPYNIMIYQVLAIIWVSLF